MLRLLLVDSFLKLLAVRNEKKSDSAAIIDLSKETGWIFDKNKHGFWGIPATSQSHTLKKGFVMVWKSIYHNNEIRIEDRWFSGEKLYVNGCLQDETFGALGCARLTGHLIDDKGWREALKVSLQRSLFGVKCRIFVNNKLVGSYPENRK